MERLFSTILSDYEGNAEKLSIVCDVCGEPLFQEVEMFGSTDGKKYVVPRTCKCRKDEAKRIAEKEVKDALESKRERMIPNRYGRECRFENAKDTKAVRAMKFYVNHWDEMRAKPGIMLYGTVGTGKTYAAYCAANALIDKGVNVYINRILNIADSMFGDRENYYYMLDRVKRCELLILDDFGADRDTDFMNEQAFKIIDARIESGKPMIITTNLTPEVMMSEKGYERKRVYDRIIGNTTPVKCVGSSMREEMYKQNRKEMTELLLKGD